MKTRKGQQDNEETKARNLANQVLERYSGSDEDRSNYRSRLNILIGQFTGRPESLNTIGWLAEKYLRKAQLNDEDIQEFLWFVSTLDWEWGRKTLNFTEGLFKELGEN